MTTHTSAYKKSSFGPAFLFLNKERREALAVYYAFCRLMDDIADEPNVSNRKEQLYFWQEEIARVYANQAKTDLGKQLTKLVKDFDISQDRFLWLIEGMQADIQGRTYKTFEELEWYLWRVAGIVGLATLDILGIKGEKAVHLAQSLGFAVQLTNIVRDVWEDADLGRVYLPEDLLAAHSLSREDVLSKKQADSLALVLQDLAEKSKLFYKQAEQILRTLPKRKVIACYVMGFVYRQNLAKIEKTHFQFAKAIKLSKLEKFKYSLYALFNPSFTD